MPVLEIVAFVLGTTGSLQQVVELISDLKVRYESDKAMGPILAFLDAEYAKLMQRLVNMQRLYVGKECYLEEESDKEFRRQFASLTELIDKANRDLTQVAAIRRKAFARRLWEAHVNVDTLQGLQRDALRATAIVADINVFLATAQVIDRVAARETNRMLEFMNQRLGTDDVCGDMFEPFFAHPINPPHVVLDYDAKDEAGKPATLEAQLKSHVLCMDNTQCQPHLHSVISVVGMGGSGKRCALKGLASDSQVRQRFPGGVHYLLFGEDATVSDALKELQKIIKHSGGQRVATSIGSNDLLEVAVAKAVQWFKDRACLLLLDDIWNRNGLGHAFLLDVGRLAHDDDTSVIAFTTRDKDLGALGKMIRFVAREPHGNESRSILLRAAGFDDVDLCEDVKRDVAKVLTVCDGLPVALAISGSVVKGFSTLHRSQIPRCRDNRGSSFGEYLRAHRNVGETIMRSPMFQYKSLWKTLHVSLDTLERSVLSSFEFETPLPISEMIRSLCVLQKQEEMPTSVLFRLWKLGSTAEACSVARCFEHASLLDLTPENDESTDSVTFVLLVRVHDLVHDFAHALAKDHEGVKYWHNALLDGYLRREEWYGENGRRPWWRISDEYMRENMERHLVYAGLRHELLHICQSSLHILWRIEGMHSLIFCILAGIAVNPVAWKRKCRYHLLRERFATGKVEKPVSRTLSGILTAAGPFPDIEEAEDEAWLDFASKTINDCCDVVPSEIQKLFETKRDGVKGHFLLNEIRYELLNSSNLDKLISGRFAIESAERRLDLGSDISLFSAVANYWATMHLLHVDTLSNMKRDVCARIKAAR